MWGPLARQRHRGSGPRRPVSVVRAAAVWAEAVRILRPIGPHIFAVITIAAVTLWVRAPACGANDFLNEDVAGITYNADLLLHGQVPLIDSVEWKAPGSFFVVAAIWRVLGRSLEVVIAFSTFWALLSALGMFVAGLQMYGFAAGLLSALIYALYSPMLDGMDFNYNAWMMAPYIWAVAFFVTGTRRGGLGWFVATGVMVVLAGLLKRQAAVVAPLFALILLLGPVMRKRPGARRVNYRRAFVAYCVGGGLGLIPIVVYYLAHGGLGAFVNQFFLNRAGWAYVKGDIDWSARWDRLGDGVLGFGQFLAIPSLVAGMSAVGVPLRRWNRCNITGVLVGGHLVCSIVGLSLGFRFFMGYYLQVLPALAWLAAHPDGPLLRWFAVPSEGTSRWQSGLLRFSGVALVVLVLVPAGRLDLRNLQAAQRGREAASSRRFTVATMSRIIKRETTPDQQIWVWGRWAWPVYYHANRRSVTPYYKVLSIITNHLTNTWRRPTEVTRFVKRGPWREVSEQLVRGRPSFIVIARNEIYSGFEALEQMLAHDYQHVMGNRSFDLWKRRERGKAEQGRRGKIARRGLRARRGVLQQTGSGRRRSARTGKARALLHAEGRQGSGTQRSAAVRHLQSTDGLQRSQH